MKSEEIAQIAGVSRSTVSRVINNYSNVPDETKEKVLKVIEQYNYQPNTCARVLAGKHNNTIGLFIVSVADSDNPNRLYKNNYFTQFVDAVVDCANNKGYYVLVNIIYCENDYNRVNEIFLQKRIDGGIVVGTEEKAESLINLSMKGFPLAILDYDPNEVIKSNRQSNNLLIINSKDYEGASEAVEYLIQLGHTEIGLLAGRMSTYSGRKRYEAYFDTLKKHGLKVNSDFILHGEFLKEKTKKEIEKLIKSKVLPTAIFSSNDDMALTAIELFKQNGIRVPEDISIIGFDDLPVSSMIKPALTTISTPIYEMVSKAVTELILNIEKDKKLFLTYSYPTDLILRETCTKK
jgi:LacI family transcriptional regulator